MSWIVLLLNGCTPNDAEVSGSFHTWLAANSSGTVANNTFNLTGAVWARAMFSRSMPAG